MYIETKKISKIVDELNLKYYMPSIKTGPCGYFKFNKYGGYIEYIFRYSMYQMKQKYKENLYIPYYHKQIRIKVTDLERC